jgi:2,3-bisphosphoglycerate-independent phosphoglycerate mutase
VKKLVLCILDGWGYRNNAAHNAIEAADIPVYRSLLKQYPHSLLQAAGEFVGLPSGQIGNSEVGHLTIGSGRRIFQDLPRIDREIANGELFKHSSIQELLSLKGSHKKCHIIGIVSDGGVHGHVKHLIAVAKFLKSQGVQIVIHGITDGRDVAPKSALKFITEIEDAGLELTSISGRFYAMDRDKRAERTQVAFSSIVSGIGAKFEDAKEYIESSYADNITDEFIVPASIPDYIGFEIGDSVFFVNYRADRMRQISGAICLPTFELFDRKLPDLEHKVIMRPYSNELSNACAVVIPYEGIRNTLGEVIAEAGLTQLRLAETEKYAHVTYFFNGGNEVPNVAEDRIMLPSPKIDTYEKTPEMSSYNITHQLVDAIESGSYDMICVNYANADMVGHTGNMDATIKSIEVIDLCLQGIVEICKRNRYELIITADHGNAECMYDEKSGQPITAHTTSPVPLIYVGPRKLTLVDGELADVAPTVLELMGVPKPDEMTGESRIR